MLRLTYEPPPIHGGDATRSKSLYSSIGDVTFLGFPRVLVFYLVTGRQVCFVASVGPEIDQAEF
jgi:hypothetical protein